MHALVLWFLGNDAWQACMVMIWAVINLKSHNNRIPVFIEDEEDGADVELLC
jgi:hypothetical protein